MPALEARVATSTDTCISDHLSWQTAFWCLAAVATNTMSQGTGRVLNVANEYSFYIKASPIICLLNTIATICFFVYDAICQRSLREAMFLWESRRFGDPAQRDEDDVGYFRKHTATRWILFILSALLPATKLFCCRGITFTQIVCGIYLATFIVDEILSGLAWLASRSSFYPEHLHPVGDGSNDLAGIALTIDAGAVLTLLSCAHDSNSDSETIIAAAVLTSGVALMSPSRNLWKFTLGIFFFTPQFGPGLIDDWIQGWEGLLWLWQGFIHPILEWIKVMSGIALLWRLTRNFFWNTRLKKYYGILIRLHGACWLATGVLMYARVYNADDTYDPRWLHIFG